MESCPLKSITQEKWGTHDALQAQRPASFGLLRSELTNSQTGVVKFHLRPFRDNGDTIGTINIV